MEEISVIKVSSKKYNKRKKKMAAGVTVRKKFSIEMIRHSVLNSLISVLFFIVIGSLCFTAVNVKSLWFETVIKPPFMPAGGVFAGINIVIMLIMMYLLCISFKAKDKAQISGIIINGVITALLFFMFYRLYSPLGSLVIICILIAQTVTILLGFYKNKKKYALLLLPLLFWQVYNMLLIYTILMLN